MVTLSRSRTTQLPITAGIARIIGYTCVAGFLSDIVVAAMPIAIKSEQWRMNLLQQMGDRGIILLFGLSLLALSYAGQRLWNQRISILSLVIGIFFVLSGLAFVRDSLVLQKSTTGAVDNQISQLQTELEKQTNSAEFEGQVTSEQLREVTQRIDLQARLYKRDVKANTVRVGLSALSNLFITGIAFISLGRYCMQTQRAAR